MKNRGSLTPGWQPSGHGIGAIPPALIEANRRLHQGDYLGAGSLFELLATRASAQYPRFAPRYVIEAGRSRLLGGQVDEGLRIIKRGLQILDGQERWADLQRIATAIVHSLKMKGFTVQADQIQEWLSQRVGQQSHLKPAAKVGHVFLSDICPNCGGAIDPRECEWISGDTIECAFCGGLVRGRVE